MKREKIISIAIYTLSAIIVLTAAILFWNLFSGNAHDFNDLGEFTGVALSATMGFEMALLVTMQLLKRELIPKQIKKHFALVTKYVRQFHYSIGALGVSVLFLHIGLTLDLKNPWSRDLITGYLTTAAIILSVIIGIFYKPKRKTVKLLHIVLAIIAVLPFFLHIL